VSKKETPAAKPAKVSAAAALIEAAKRKQTAPTPPPEAMHALRELVAYNDTTGAGGRVPAVAAIEMLRECGWPCSSRTGLDSLCKRELGRKSYGTK
jgi:hypothetical protein